ncbi:hypothetical protein Ancab_036594 [Ancistrocladus abbreviatus]
MVRNMSLSGIIFFFFLLLLSSFNRCNSQCNLTKRSDGFRGMFVFGSSVVDNGNNNNLPTLSKANYLPYGIDYPLGPTGRFSDGKNVADVLGDYLKLPPLPPALDPSTGGHRILHGVNYASAGSGILDSTGPITGVVINLNNQITKFEKVTVPELEAQLSCTRTEILPHYLFFIGAGGNDLLGYFRLNNASNNVTLDTFTTNLLAAYFHRLKRLYNIGARKFALLGIDPIGCGPAVRARTANNSCNESQNAAARLFNSRLRSMVDAFDSKLSGSQFVVVNRYNIIRDVIQNAAARGFRNVTGACCELSVNGILCKKNGSVCPDRRSYAYFDGLHGTQAVSSIIAAEAYASNNQSEVYPFNIQKLSQL